MFEFFGALLRLPVGLALMCLVLVTWPIGALLIIFVWIGKLIITPFKFLVLAFIGDKVGWRVWSDEISFRRLDSNLLYPVDAFKEIFRWVVDGPDD